MSPSRALNFVWADGGGSVVQTGLEVRTVGPSQVPEPSNRAFQDPSDGPDGQHGHRTEPIS